MAQKCVRQGCGKAFADVNEPCVYHPGPPIFHEGQKGWKCCKPRVLTFDEFLTIPPCTTGIHSTTEAAAKLEEAAPVDQDELDLKISKMNAAAAAAANVPGRKPVSAPQAVAATPPPPPESEDDDPSLDIPDGKTCRRRTCGAAFKAGASRDGESCVYHPGVPIFHEGSKGYTCCKRRVMEFEQFMKLEGCTTKNRHLFIGSGLKEKKATNGAEEILETVRRDFYQTVGTVIASFFLKKIVKEKSTVEFTDKLIKLDLVTSDPTPKRFTKDINTFGLVDPAKSEFKILGTKLEVVLAKGDDSSWPVLSSDDAHSGEILQVGRAGRMQA
ncbi:cord and cs domain-containing protein [Ceratocystis lukuohia]|uniref:Cysteine and histidine-rich domain-containing protein RAR1 n=2 Tax=Ceratocystis TaxID=5157 RepID=A0A2C5X9C3_9PEZI|nr:Cysteine and histidine-rich domain-containing protein RAR1 [Ceratocystis fimbriata CBS 114723]